jgi:hypothetical protein
MKRIILAAALMLLTFGAVSAQNNFRGIVKYKITSTGKVDLSIPEDQSVVEIKVYDDQLLYEQTIQKGLKVSQAIDFSQAIAYLAANGIELETYTGDGKFIVRHESTKAELDSIYLVDQEAGHFYYENVNETQEMLGYTVHKMVMHRYDEEGSDNPAICWYSTEIGPEYCLVMGNIKGFPFVYTQELGEGRAVTFTAIEVQKGKVKDVDMLLPAGYKDASGEEFETFRNELKDAIELLED